MRWLRRLFAERHPRERRLSLRAQDCPSCWKARAHALHWGKTACSDCGRVYRAWRFGSTRA